MPILSETVSGKLPDDVHGIINNILVNEESTYTDPPHPPRSCGTPNTHERSFFLAGPMIKGPAKNAAYSTTMPHELDDC